MSKVHEYEGAEVVVQYDKGLCIHAAECVRGLPRVFDPQARPWVSPDAAPAEEVERVVKRCPTGALALEHRDGRPAEAPQGTSSVRLEPDGPLYLRGRLSVTAADGTELASGSRLALCRCGASENKPFCDGSHSKAAFRDDGSGCSRPVREEPDPGQDLAVTVSSDGPLVARGALEVRSADDRRLFAGDRLALCRCGASKEKPYCDGSHGEVGFKAG